jgi:hypothetical protein
MGSTNSRKMRWWDKQHAWGRGEMHTGFWWGNMKGNDSLGNLNIDGRILLQLSLKKQAQTALTGLICLRIGTSGMLL